ncbi:MAG TPA: hypothetical protein VGC50_04130 [Gammaproteobacteria bacterium]|jgi:hypothetical protein
MFRVVIATVALSLSTLSSAWAYRVLDQIENAYELTLGVVTLPAGSSGSVIFTACETCRTTSLRVSAETTYFANGSQVSLADLRGLADRLRATAAGRERTAVYVFYDPRTLQVTRLALGSAG